MPDASNRNATREARERLAELLLRTESFKFSEEPAFPLASGVLSRFYVDCRTLLSHAEARALAGQLLLERVGFADVDVVGGLLIGAYPVAIAVSDAAYRASARPLRVFVVRKEAKRHGLGKLVEGDVRRGDRALIVEDVITSGKSTVEAIAKSRDAGLAVVGALALIDRGEQGGRQAIEAEGVPFDCVFTLEDLKRARERRSGPEPGPR